MQFETRFVNGKPNIYFKEGPTKGISKNIHTKDKLAEVDIRDSLEISGELVKVKGDNLKRTQTAATNNKTGLKNTNKSSYGNRSQLKTTQPKKQSINDNKTVTLTQEQLNTLINEVATKKAMESTRNYKNSLENVNDDDQQYYRNQQQQQQQQQRRNDSVMMPRYNKPNIVVISDNEEDTSTVKNNSYKVGDKVGMASKNLLEKKKLKWEQDKSKTGYISKDFIEF
jgi:membrane-bound lytic murein transglycosylase